MWYIYLCSVFFNYPHNWLMRLYPWYYELVCASFALVTCALYLAFVNGIKSAALHSCVFVKVKALIAVFFFSMCCPVFCAPFFFYCPLKTWCKFFLFILFGSNMKVKFDGYIFVFLRKVANPLWLILHGCSHLREANDYWEMFRRLQCT